MLSPPGHTTSPVLTLPLISFSMMSMARSEINASNKMLLQTFHQPPHECRGRASPWPRRLLLIFRTPAKHRPLVALATASCRPRPAPAPLPGSIAASLSQRFQHDDVLWLLNSCRCWWHHARGLPMARHTSLAVTVLTFAAWRPVRPRPHRHRRD